MAAISRRQFVRQTIFSAAFYAGPLKYSRDLRAVSDEYTTAGASLDPESIHRLAGKISGVVITPDRAEYDEARLIFNRAFDRHPAVIVRCTSPSDVARVLEFAQIKHLPLAVRSGGHSRLGYGMCDGGVVVDLSSFRRVEVDRTRRVAVAQAGALVRDLDQATQRYGLATTSGGCPTVGIAGFTLGGGEGRLMDKYGAACDNLRSAEVVTVDGKQLKASQTSNPDLFWAIRGGGGNFGVVTALEYQLHSVGQVLSGALLYASSGTAELIEAFSRFLEDAPDEMDAFAQLMPSRQGARVRIDVCYCGEPRVGIDLIRRLRALRPQEDTVRVQSYLDAQSAGGFLQRPVAHFQTNVFVRELSGPVLAAVTTALKDVPAKCKLILVPLRGAISRVRVSDMAFALREPGCEIDITGVWDTAEEKDAAVHWVLTTRNDLQPFAHGVYVNQLGDTSDQLVRSAYGANYARLVEIKRKYDPTNLLRLNQNIGIGDTTRTE